MDPQRRAFLTGAGVVAGAVATAGLLDACTGTASNTGSGVDQSAGNINDLTVQEGELTVAAFNKVKTVPGAAYPADLMTDSLEMHQQYEKLLRFNRSDKIGYLYLFLPGVGLVAYFTVAGKVSSTQSSMSSSQGVYSASSGGNVPVPLPGDDLSWGPNEGGEAGQFFFTNDAVYVYSSGFSVLYLDAPLDILQEPVSLKYRSGSKPTSIAKGSTLF